MEGWRGFNDIGRGERESVDDLDSGMVSCRTLPHRHFEYHGIQMSVWSALGVGMTLFAIILFGLVERRPKRGASF